MKTITLSGQKFSLDDKSHAFLKNYLNRIRSYIRKNNLDIELLQDIEERIFEYLNDLKQQKKRITQEKIVNIVNEIGEPEEIFENYDEEESLSEEPNTLQKFATFFQKIVKRFFNDDPLFLGVCTFLARKSKIPAVFYRFLFIATAFFYGVSIVIYLILAFLFVGSQELLNRRDSVSSSLIQAIAGLRDSFFKLIRWCFFLALSLAFIGIAGATLFGAAFTNTPWTIDNQNILAYLPTYIPWSFLAISIAFIIFAIWSLGMLFRKTFLYRIFYFLSVIVLVFGLFGLLSGSFIVLNHYTTVYENTQTFEIAAEEDELYFVQLPNPNQNKLIEIGQHWTQVDFLPTKNAKIQIKFISQINATSEQEASEIFNNLTPLEVETNENTFIFEKSGKTFQTATPFAFYKYRIEVLLPENVRIQFQDTYSHLYFHNVNEYVEKNNLQLHFNAQFNPIGYDSVTKRFRVYPTATTFQEIQEERLEQDREQQFERKQAILDNIYLLQKGNSSLIITPNEQLTSFEWLDPQKAQVKVGERCFTIYYTSYGPWPDETYEECEKLEENNKSIEESGE